MRQIKKSDRRHWFFFPPSLECFEPPAASSQSAAIWGHVRRPLAYRLPFIYIQLFFSCVAPPPAFLWSAPQFTTISAQFFILFLDFHPGDLWLLSAILQRHDSLVSQIIPAGESVLFSRLFLVTCDDDCKCSNWRCSLSFIVWVASYNMVLFLSLKIQAVMVLWNMLHDAFRDKNNALLLPLPRWSHLLTESIWVTQKWQLQQPNL